MWARWRAAAAMHSREHTDHLAPASQDPSATFKFPMRCPCCKNYSKTPEQSKIAQKCSRHCSKSFKIARSQGSGAATPGQHSNLKDAIMQSFQGPEVVNMSMSCQYLQGMRVNIQDQFCICSEYRQLIQTESRVRVVCAREVAACALSLITLPSKLPGPSQPQPAYL